MVRYSSVLLAAVLIIGSSGVAAQGVPAGGGINSPHTPEGLTTGYMSQGDVKDLADFVDNTRQLERKDLVSQKIATQRSTARRCSALFPLISRSIVKIASIRCSVSMASGAFAASVATNSLRHPRPRHAAFTIGPSI